MENERRLMLWVAGLLEAGEGMAAKLREYAEADYQAQGEQSGTWSEPFKEIAPAIEAWERAVKGETETYMTETQTITVTWSLDEESVRLARAAAALKGLGIQAFVSECLRNCAAQTPGLVVEPRAPYTP